jgi:hypothetical protein
MSDNRRTIAFRRCAESTPATDRRRRIVRCRPNTGTVGLVCQRSRMTTSSANPFNLKTCKLCGRRYASWGAHMEECNGPPPKKPSDA